ATICMALVIFCVALTEAMRLRRSFREAISIKLSARTSYRKPARSGEGFGIGRNDRFQSFRGAFGQILRRADGLQKIGVLRPQQGEQPFLERLDAIERQRIEIAVDAGID